MHDDTSRFLNSLYSRCPAASDLRLTLTALHPDGQHPTPSRHIPFGDKSVLHDALERLEIANRCGWGAFVGVGLRKTGLDRYRRGGLADVVLLPALFVDIDDRTEAVLHRLHKTSPPPSCIISTGGGYHAYWWLDKPTQDLNTARQIMQALAVSLNGDRLSPAQSMRLPGSRNTKLSRHNASCEIISLTDRYYALSHFADITACYQPATGVRPPFSSARKSVSTSYGLNPDLITAAAETFWRWGYRRSGQWLKGRCPYPHRHSQDDQHPSFGFNTDTGYGYCFRCGSILLKDICQCLQLDPHLYGGLCCCA